MRRFSAIPILIALSACSSAAPRAARVDTTGPERLGAADALVKAGCYDCLAEAYRQYDALRAVPTVARAATLGALEAAGLLAIREHELGMGAGDFLRTARDLASGLPDPGWFPDAFELVELLPASVTGVAGPPASDDELPRLLGFHRNFRQHQALLRAHAGDGPFAAYLWATFMCASPEARDTSQDEIFAGAWSPEAPLLQFRRASCRGLDRKALETIETNDARFGEIDFLLGLSALGRVDLDAADQLLRRAYAWKPRWPALTQTLGNVALTAEDFDAANAFYDDTLLVEPRAVEARLGKVRALTYLGRHDDAIGQTDLLLEARWRLGEARYWRALNETQIERYDPAWTDIEEAAKLLINADVPKLAGIIAYRRGERPVARTKFEESLQRKGDDCETSFYLGVVLGDDRAWPEAIEVLARTAACIDANERRLSAEIDDLRKAALRPDRQARQIARREREIAAGRRMRATAWFNTAVGHFNLAHKAEARQFAEKLVDDEQFGERAREILKSLR